MLLDILFVLAVIGILIAIYKTKFSQKKSAEEIKAEVLRQQQTKKTTKETLKEEPKQQKPAAEWTGEESNSEASDQQQTTSPSSMDSRKQLYKQQKRREKQQRKQAQQHFLQQQKKQRQQYEKEQQEKERQQQERKRKQEQYIEQMRQEERLRREEEFNKWKDMFQVQESGVSKESEDQIKRKQLELESQLVTYLISKKLTLLEDASHKFALPTKQLVQKIKKLQAQGRINGVFDQRGKFLYIEDQQWNSVKSYITAKGRLKKTDMMNQCAKIIKIPEQDDEELLRLVQVQQKAN